MASDISSTTDVLGCIYITYCSYLATAASGLLLLYVGFCCCEWQFWGLYNVFTAVEMHLDNSFNHALCSLGL